MKCLIFCLSLVVVLTGCMGPVEYHYVARKKPYQDRISNAIASARLCEFTEGPQLFCRPRNEQKGSISEKDSVGNSSVLEATGLCVGDRYEFYIVRQDGLLVSGGDYVVSEELQLVSSDDQRMLSDFRLDFGKFMKGETISFVLVCKNKNITMAAVVAPNPIEASWPDGATVSITALRKQMDVFILVGQGFHPNESVRFISKSWDEILDKEHACDETGHLRIMLAPMVKGKEDGINQISLERLSTGEKRCFEFPYGEAARKK